MPPIFAASSREAPSSTAAIANSRRACAASFARWANPANFAGGIVRPHRNSVAHGKPPQFAILNHAAVDSGIPRESDTQRLGISRIRPPSNFALRRCPAGAGSCSEPPLPWRWAAFPPRSTSRSLTDWNAAPPMDDKSSFIEWMVRNRGEETGFLGQRWDRFRQAVASRDLWDPRDLRAFLLTPRAERRKRSRSA